MSQRNKKKPRRKSAAALENGLLKMTQTRMHHADRIKTLDAKIAAQEDLVQIAKEEEAEAK